MFWASAACHLDASLSRCFEHVQLDRGPGTDPGPSGEIMSCSWLGNVSLGGARVGLLKQL